jgi:predicted  nucleic acid-binding Zn-ribbon protein
VKHEHQDTDTLIRASLETLVKHFAEDSRLEIAALRTALDEALSSLEPRLSASDRNPSIQATVKSISRIFNERLDRERQQAEATLAQALAANSQLQTDLAEAHAQLNAARADTATAAADRKENARLAAELDRAHAQLVDLRVQLKRSQEIREELAAERADLQGRLGEVTTARAFAEAQHAQLANLSQQLTEALSKSLHQTRGERRPATDASAAQPNDDAPKQKPSPGASQTNAAASKKVLKFSDQARDSKRIAIRQGTHIAVESIPGELVDLSVGGAQVVLRHSVKPNQLVRLQLPGELVAKARVVWVLFEHRETSLSVYRAGLKLTDVDIPAIERFMSDFCKAPLAQSRSS